MLCLVGWREGYSRKSWVKDAILEWQVCERPRKGTYNRMMRAVYMTCFLQKTPSWAWRRTRPSSCEATTPARAPRFSCRWMVRCTASSPPSDEERICLCAREDSTASTNLYVNKLVVRDHCTDQSGLLVVRAQTQTDALYQFLLAAKLLAFRKLKTVQLVRYLS